MERDLSQSWVTADPPPSTAHAQGNIFTTQPHITSRGTGHPTLPPQGCRSPGDWSRARGSHPARGEDAGSFRRAAAAHRLSRRPGSEREGSQHNGAGQEVRLQPHPEAPQLPHCQGGTVQVSSTVVLVRGNPTVLSVTAGQGGGGAGSQDISAPRSAPDRKEGGTNSYSPSTVPPQTPSSPAKEELWRGCGIPEPSPTRDGVSGRS